jgi:ADP-heptose:LPS heptosyltransferase
MGKYLLENIRAAYPDAHCTIAVSTRAAMIRDLFAAYSWIHVLELNRSSLGGVLSVGRQDIVVTPYTGGVFPLRSKLLARILGRKLFGYVDQSAVGKFLYTKLVPLVGRARAPRLLEVDALTAIGVPVAFERPGFTYVPQPELLARLGLQEKQYVVLHLFSGGNARGLSPKHKWALITALRAAITLPVVLTGTPKELASLGELPGGVHGVHTSLQELAHLVDHAACMVSLDTGAAHIAAHLRKPLVVLASCVGIQWWGPDMYGTANNLTVFDRVDVCPQGHDYSGYAKCLDAIDMDEVAQAVARMV